MRKTLIIPIVGALGLLIFIFYQYYQTLPANTPIHGQESNLNSKVSEINTNTVAEANDESRQAVKNENHSQSLMKLMNTELDGSKFEVGVVQSDNFSYTRYTITYQSDGRTVSGIMNVPKGDGPFPVLFLNHGYIDPAVYTNGRGLKREQDYLARNGYVVVHSDYRGHALGDPFDDSVYSVQGLGYYNYSLDVLNAIKAVADSELSYIDADRVGLLGHSMGGGVSQNIMVANPEMVDAVVLFAPVSTNYLDNFNKWRRPDNNQEQLQILTQELGDLSDHETFAAFSSRTYFDLVDDPVLIHHGTADESVPIEWSRETRDLLLVAGKDVVLDEYKGEYHEFGPDWGLVMERTLAFFNEHL